MEGHILVKVVKMSSLKTFHLNQNLKDKEPAMIMVVGWVVVVWWQKGEEDKISLPS